MTSENDDGDGEESLELQRTQQMELQIGTQYDFCLTSLLFLFPKDENSGSGKHSSRPLKR